MRGSRDRLPSAPIRATCDRMNAALDGARMIHAVGIHFGHDSGLAKIGENGIVRYASKERISRVKHAMGLSVDDLDGFLSACDVVGLSSTQDVPIPVFPEIGFKVEGAREVNYADWVGQTWSHYKNYLRWWRDVPSRGLLVDEETFSIPTLDRLHASHETEDLRALRAALIRRGTTTYRGREIRTLFFSHHLLHAEYANFTMGDKEGTLIVSCDGGWGPTFHGGGVFYSGDKLRQVVPLASLDAWIGQFYQSVGRALGLGEDGSGKLMGLAAYGRPVHVDKRLVGTRSEVLHNCGLATIGRFGPGDALADQWLREISGEIYLAWDKSAEIPPEIVSDIAASAQLLVELNQSESCRRAIALARDINLPVKKLLLSGGVALNCPANSKLSSTLDLEVDCPPAVNDEGLCIGAAAAAFAETTQSYPVADRGFGSAVFLGYRADIGLVSIEAGKNGYALMEQTGSAAIARCARLIREGDIVALFTGKSEVGPRALGHRSILADATDLKQWQHVNRVKGREIWRPLAPAVLEEDWELYFGGIRYVSRYMLFNYRVKTKSIPAVTHFDLTARAQIVNSENGILFDVLLAFKAVSGVGVLINTSFNGPGRPIVETEADAFQEARTLGISHVMTDAGLFGNGSHG